MSAPAPQPPYGPGEVEQRNRVATSWVVGWFVVLLLAAGVSVGLVVTGVPAGRAAAYGECRTVGQSGCVTRSTVVVQQVGARKNKTTWTADGFSEFTIDRSDAYDLGLEDGASVDLVAYGSQVLVVEGNGERLELALSGYRRVLGGALGLVAALSLAISSAIQVRTGEGSAITARSSLVGVGICVGVGVGFVLLLTGASITATAVTAAGACAFGALVGALLRPDALDRR